MEKEESGRVQMRGEESIIFATENSYELPNVILISTVPLSPNLQLHTPCSPLAGGV